MTSMTDMAETKLASIWDRFVAAFIDAMILIVPCIVLHFTLPFIAPLMVSLLYYPIFHASAWQATIGKKVMGIQVTDMHGQPLTLCNAFLRDLVATASSVCFFAGHFFVFFNRKHQALHDLAAGSLVIEGQVPELMFWEAWLLTMRRLIHALSTSTPLTSVRSPVDELERLGRLREQGAITEEEYQHLKSKLIP